jgi:hypothetical protein
MTSMTSECDPPLLVDPPLVDFSAALLLHFQSGFTMMNSVHHSAQLLLPFCKVSSQPSDHLVNALHRSGRPDLGKIVSRRNRGAPVAPSRRIGWSSEEVQVVEPRGSSCVNRTTKRNGAKRKKPINRPSCVAL